MKHVLALTLAAGMIVSAAADQTVRIKNLKVLAVIYRGAPDEESRMDDSTVEMVKNGLEVGRLFYFRNSSARLNVELVWMVVDVTAPENAGPTMEHMEADLRERGVKDGEYDGLIVTGVGLKGNWGGFNLFGGAGGCFGSGGRRSVGYPEFDPETGYGWAWIFAHEFQHAFDLVIVESSKLEMLHAHPYVDRKEPFFKGRYIAGEHWDWIGLTLREFNDYLKIRGVRNQILECVDADGDGLADADPRLPTDEKRFGSDPSKKDTDGDGLDDLSEFTANPYLGSDPTKPDTDGDSLNDADDPYPVVAMEPTMVYTRPGNPAVTFAPLLEGAFARDDAGGTVAVWGAWSEEKLYLELRGPRPFTASIKIDGSAANGYWEGGDTYPIRVSAEKVEFAGLGLNGPVPGARVHKTFDEPGKYYLVAIIPVGLGQGVSKEINYGGKREAADVVPGLTLVENRSVGFNFIYKFGDGTQAALTPHHTMYATKLAKPADAPDYPILRGPAITNAARPTVEVLGVRPQSKVRIVMADKSAASGVLGKRTGSGPVHLAGLDKDGTFEILAAVDELTSKTISLTIDRSAAAPAMTLSGKTVRAECEPQAAFELWWGRDGVAIAPVDGARADDQGHAEVTVDGEHLRGWTVTGFEGSQFERKVFVDSWDKIDRLFQGGPADDRLPPDDFSFRCAGFLKIEHAARYTFELNTDDGSRLYINDEVVLDHWGHHGMTPKTSTVQLEEGLHPLRIDYYEEDGWAGFKFLAGADGQERSADLPVFRAPVPTAELELFGVQMDRLGNRSGFSPAVRVGE